MANTIGPKFFHSIDYAILFNLIKEKIHDQNALWLVKLIIDSFEINPRKGIPLGNVTSQLFANIYLNELDQYVKHILKEKFYIRYSDDFIIINSNRQHLINIVQSISEFLNNYLSLTLNSQKIIIRKFRQGIDFLGYVISPHHIVLRTKTKRRMLKKLLTKQDLLLKGLIDSKHFNQSLQSYLGILNHCNSYDLQAAVKNIYSARKPLVREAT